MICMVLWGRLRGKRFVLLRCDSRHRFNNRLCTQVPKVAAKLEGRYPPGCEIHATGINTMNGMKWYTSRMSWEQLFAEAKDVCIRPIHHEQKLQIAFGDPCFLCVVPVAPPAWISDPGGYLPSNFAATGSVTVYLTTVRETPFCWLPPIEDRTWQMVSLALNLCASGSDQTFFILEFFLDFLEFLF